MRPRIVTIIFGALFLLSAWNCSVAAWRLLGFTSEVLKGPPTSGLGDIFALPGLVAAMLGGPAVAVLLRAVAILFLAVGVGLLRENVWATRFARFIARLEFILGVVLLSIGILMAVFGIDLYKDLFLLYGVIHVAISTVMFRHFRPEPQ